MKKNIFDHTCRRPLDTSELQSVGGGAAYLKLGDIKGESLPDAGRGGHVVIKTYQCPSDPH